jgi:hypothetical protein
MEVRISERALIKRINRKLKPEYKQLRTAQGSSESLGRYYMVDVCRNFIQDYKVDLEVLGRDLKVLATFEKLAE